MSKIVHRTLEVFETFAAQKRPLSLTELSRLLGIPQSSCHDVVQALQERGYLYEIRPRGGHYPTAKLFHVAREIQDNDPVAQRAESSLQALSERLHASVSLAKARDEAMVYLVVCAPPDPLRFMVSVGAMARNLHATSVGKCLLGSLDQAQRRAVVERLDMVPLTPHTITSREALLRDIELSEMRGWYENCEESVEDALTFSVRFRWNAATYAITAAGTRNRMERQREAAVNDMLAVARQLGDAT